MRMNTTVKAIAALGSAAMLLPLAACGGNAGGNTAGGTEVTIYTQAATYEGKLDGYSGKGFKDATGQDITVVPDSVGGTSRFQTRLTTGNLGDLVLFTSRTMLKDAIDAGAVEDLNEYKDKLPNVFRFKDGIARMESNDDGKVYGVPTGLQNDAKLSVGDPTSVPSMRYDYYKELGSPQVSDYWGYKDVAIAMAEAHPKTEKGDNFYALSLFGGWDGTSAGQIRSIATAMGWVTADGVNKYDWINLDPINKKTEDILADNSLYLQGLKWANDFYQAGQLDPDSATQTWDDYLKKGINGQSAMWVYGYIGNLNFNPENKDLTEQNKGYERIFNDELKVVEPLSTIGASDGWYWGLSSNASNKEGALKVLDFLYSDEGSFMCEDGPEGVLWEMKDGKPALTELGKKPWSTTEVPEEYGGGKIADTFKARVNGQGAAGYIEKYNSTSVYNQWDSYLKDNASNLDKEWQADHNGALNAKAVMNENGMAEGFEVKNVEPMEWSDEDKVVSQSVGDVVKQYSWKMIYANSDSEFESLEKEMISKAKSLGYDKCVEFEEGFAQKFFDAK